MTSRLHGVVGSAAGLTPFGHLGWGYRDRREFHRRAAEYLTDGVRQGQFVVFVGGGSSRSLTAELTAVRKTMSADVADAPVTVIPAEQFYSFVPGTGVVDPEASVAERVAATERAVADGHSGFRAVVDATPVARTEAQRRAFARFEILVDQQMARFPVSALCAYDMAELDGAADLICLHPFVSHSGGAYRVFAAPDADVAVAGVVDAEHATAVVDAVNTAFSPAGSESVTVDAGGADHLAAECVLRLDRAARRDGRSITLLVRASAVEAIDGRLSHVRIEPPVVPAPDPVLIAELQAKVSQLHNRLASQPAIEQCKGMLMSAFGLTAEDAFELLKSLSQNGNLKLREVARAIVDEWRIDGPRPDYDRTTEFLLRARDAVRYQRG
ncbi:MEDS domain-containing protein [Mycobacterium kyogaense]|uniref:MEDS domain-containing protein n=1 Tax=Mycobacterium kyogaense TaxID=2212479 RepID=UPI000DAD6F5D|nr:MEDS domain-containing protein [Mycobacterium kyogaense]